MRTKTLSLSLVSLLVMSLILSAEEKGRVCTWQDYFPDLLERVYFIMKDNMLFTHTDCFENTIHLRIESLEKEFKTSEKGYEIKDIKIVIHNHFIRCKFSPADKKYYRDLKKRGFKGQFLIYCHRTKEVYDIEEKGKPKQ